MIHIFVGPTLPQSEPLLREPRIRVCPPVGHGDLFDSAIRDSDTVVIIDGVYHQAPALRHKEILAAMARGVWVIGAASIGALRAAELEPYGMRGIGTIYRRYAWGLLHGDDEVAVGQATGDGADSLTWPLVNLRYVLKTAVTRGVLGQERADGLLEALREVYYPQRTPAAVRAVCRRYGEEGFGQWLTERRRRNPHFGDLKRSEALSAVRAALRDPLTAAPVQAPPPVWRTVHFQRWSNAFARSRVDGLELSTEDRLIYQQVFAPQFAAVWTAYLEHRSLHPADGGPRLPLTARLARVTGGGLDAHQVFHPVPDLRDETTTAMLLAEESAEDRRSVAQYARALEEARRSRPGFSAAAICDGLTRRSLQQIWRCPAEEFDAEASSRGLMSGARAVEAAKRMMPGFMDERTEAVRAAR
ncbi:TfuA-like protein [Streptomyces scabiei]|uniref:TfuA-like protein n=1 Tax=Streptomyces scabiei TaxID=1930 RepID=UPI00298F2633|nr:TfuA-like protein [Streptomyces scabiei]MDW8478333.1 TfuA-like protein [Streptomyces scabiei]